MSNALGDKIRRLRKDLGLTLDELARQTDSSKGYIWELENRDTRNPSSEKLMKIAEILQTSTDFLLDTKMSEPDDAALKTALYRNFDKLEPEDKERFMSILKGWNKD